MTLQPGEIVLEAALASDPAATSPAWTDLSSLHRASDISIAGRSDPLDQPSAATLESRLANTLRTLDPAIDSRVRPRKRCRVRSPGNGFSRSDTATFSGGVLTADDRRLGFTEFFPYPKIALFHAVGEAAFTASGSSYPWTNTESKTGGTFTDQFIFGTTTPAPRRFARRIEFKVRPGDKFGSTTGERAEFLFTPSVENVNQEWCYRFSTYFPAGYTRPASWNIFCQFHSDSRFNQAPYKFQVDQVNGADVLSLVMTTGPFANSGQALSPIESNNTRFTGFAPISLGKWHDFVMRVRYSDTGLGTVQVWHRLEDDTEFSQVVNASGLYTLAKITGDATPGTILRKWGNYRNDEASLTTTLFQEGYSADGGLESMLYEAPTPHRGAGIFVGATNNITNSDALTNLTNWSGQSGATLSRVTDQDLLGSNTAFKIAQPGSASSERAEYAITLTAGNVYAFSGWLKGAIGQRVRGWVVDSASANLGSQTITCDGGWTWFSVVFTATANNTHKLRFGRTATGAAEDAYGKGFQLETRAFSTPRVRTDGSTAARIEARVQIPSAHISGGSADQGWVAIVVRPGWDSASPPGGGTGLPRIFEFYKDASNNLRVFYDEATQAWRIGRQAGGAGNAISVPARHVRGQRVLIVGAWTSTQIKLSVNGFPFATIADTAVASGYPANFDIGADGLSSGTLINGEVSWAAFGRGTLTDADARRIDDEIGAPLPSDRVFGATADVRASWNGASEQLLLNADATFFDGFAESFNPSWPAGGFDAEVMLRASDATNILATKKLPDTNPSEEDFADYLETFRPTLLHTFDEDAGTKAVAHVRKKRKRRKGESRRHYRKHGYKHWKTRETRAEAEGTSGPAGSYKNTPLLGQSPLIRGSFASSVRLRNAQNEWIRIPLDASDTDLVDGNKLTIGMFIQLASIPTAGSPTWTLISFPVGAAVGQDNPIARMTVTRHDASSVALGGVFQLGASHGDVNSGSFGPWFGTSDVMLVVIHWDGVSTSSGYFAGGSVGDTVILAGTQDTGDAGTSLSTPVTGDAIMIGRDHGTSPQYSDVSVSHFFTIERALAVSDLQRIYNAGRLRGFDGEASFDRGQAILDAIGWPATMVDLTASGGRNVSPRRQFGQSPLEELQLTSEAEQPGFIYVSRDGKVKGRLSTYVSEGPSMVPVATFGDDPTMGEIPYRSVEVEYSEDTIRNTITIDREESDTEYTISDATSIGAYWESPEDLGTVIVDNDADFQAIAASRLAALKDPSERPIRLELDADMDDRIVPLLGSLEIGDLVRIWRQPVGPGFRKVWDVRISGGSITIAGLKLSGSFDLAPADL